MKKLLKIFWVSAFILSSLLTGKTGPGPDSEAGVDISLRKEAERSILIGFRWLVDQQEEDGSWNRYPAITALVLSAITRADATVNIEHPAIQAGYKYLESCVQENGSVHVGDMPGYNTSICLLAFKDYPGDKYKKIIRNAEAYLVDLQIDEKDGYTRDSLYYGGVGYGGDDRPDLSNLQWAIEAIAYKEKQIVPEQKAGPVEKAISERNMLFYDKALVFLARCQNLESVNPEAYSGNDGGFMYEAGKSKAGEASSYGSMSYAGLKSMIYAKVDKADPRVQAAYDWLRQNYSVETNPNMGIQGLFYYYQSMAKALSAYGEEVVVTPDKKQHPWRKELVDQLLKIQNEEGWWVNSNGRWWENNKVLVTAYCLLTMEELLR